MTRGVAWADTARADYLAIIRHIASDNPDAAMRVARRIEQAAERLGDMPTGRRGRVAGTYEKSLPGLPYIIAYEILATPTGSEQIVILHVIHGARHWPPGDWPAA